MKHVISATLVAGALALGTSAASAADMPLKAPEIVPVFTWTGWYIGGNVGWMRGNADIDPVCSSFNNPDCPTLFPGFAFTTNIPGVPPMTTVVPGALGALPGVSGSDKSFMGGGQIGYNWQVQHAIFGVEADLDWTHIRMSLSQNAIAPPGVAPGFFGTVNANSAFSNDWVGSVRGRLGLAFDRFMIYGTGGLAFAGTTVNTAWAYTPPGNAIPAFNLPGPTGNNEPQVLMGWTAGVGGEWYVGERVSVGAEYRHSDFGHQNYTIGFDVTGAPISANIHYTTDQVTLRANWHFDGR
jgi:outer membrane immunogenic protein